MTDSELRVATASATNQVDNQDRARRLAAVAAGLVLLVASVAGLHHLHRAGDQLGELITWSLLLLGLFTALGGGVKLIMWGLRPVTAAAVSSAKERLSEPIQAVLASLAVIVGVLGMWWSFRGGYSAWWQQITGEAGWSLIFGVGQMFVAVLAGASLFTGGKYLFGLAREVVTGVDDAGAHRNQSRNNQNESLWHPGLVAALVGGGLGLVLLTAGIAPRLYVWITGPQVLPAAGAITLVLLVAIFSNLGWWKGLAGLYKWATAASEKATATAGVIAVLMFSASGLGLGWFTPATVPQAHAACPPDCGSPGGGNDGPPGGGQMFQPPSQGGPQMADYQGGINQPPMDQNGSVSIYNTQAPSISNNGANGSNGMQGPQQGWDQPAHGTQIPDYQNATPYTQGPGKPNPDFNGGQTNPGTNAGSQGGQANQGAPQQQPPANQGSQQPPSQNNSGQQPPQQNTEQPNQSSDQQKIDDLMRQLQQQQQQSGQDRQRIDDLTKQLQQGQQKQNGNQKLPKFPSKDDKKDRDQQDRDKQSGNNDLAALLMGAASTRRRKQNDQEKEPDTQALGQDASQMSQSLPGDISNTVSDSANLGQSAGSAAQNFGQAGQAGASLASSAQSGTVNPQDVITLVQGVSGGIKDTADAVKSGSQITSTWLENGSQSTKIVSDINPQSKQQMQQVQQFLDDGKQGADAVNKVADLTSQGAGAVNSASSMNPSQTQSVELMSGDASALSGRFMQGGGDQPQLPPLTGNRQKAIDYANKWANGANPEYRDFGVGYECTNFVSQAMREGGFKDVGPNITDLRGGDSDEWYYQRDPFQIYLGIGDIPSQPHSTTWSLARENHNFITQQSGRGEIVSIVKTPPALEGSKDVVGTPDKTKLDPLAPSKAGLIPGDLIYYKESNGDISHVAMLVGQEMRGGVLTDIVSQHAGGDNNLRNDWMPESKDYAGGQAEFVHLAFPGD